MEEYRFKTSFVEGKTFTELTEEEKARLQKGIAVKKEDKEFLAKMITEIKENAVGSIELVDEVPEGEPLLEHIDIVSDEEVEDEELSKNIENNTEKLMSVKTKPVQVITAVGREIVLADGRNITLTNKELKEKPFWKKGDVYGN